MSIPTGLNLGASAYVPASKPTFAPQPVPRNPALAFLLSLLLPGLGQFYCRKNSRGAWTLALFLFALSITIWLTPMLVGDSAVLAALGWGVLLRVAVFPGSQITEHQIAARKGMTLYILTTDSLTDSTAACQSDFRFIQQHLVLPK